MWLQQPYGRCILLASGEGGRFYQAGEADSDASMESDNLWQRHRLTVVGVAGLGLQYIGKVVQSGWVGGRRGGVGGGWWGSPGRDVGCGGGGGVGGGAGMGVGGVKGGAVGVGMVGREGGTGVG